MSISAALLPEYDQEMANLRKTLERIRDDKFDYKPHPRSNSVSWMMNHLANIPSWITYTMSQDSLDIAPAGVQSVQQYPSSTTAGVLETLDKNVAAGRKALESASDEKFMEKWQLLKTGVVVLTLPRVAVIRSMVLNHMIHHRAQLTVYMRLNDIPVPGLYGPSADEQNF